MMTDYDETRERRKANSVRTTQLSAKKAIYDCTCVKCGMNYMLIDVSPYSIPGAMSEDGFLCKNCRPTAPKREYGSPPPRSLQMTIDEMAKK